MNLWMVKIKKKRKRGRLYFKVWDEVVGLGSMVMLLVSSSTTDCESG